ncbi:MAG: peptidylprolyl isomerase, partial [Pseudomonadota bacterium]
MTEEDLDRALDFARRPVQESVLLQEIAIDIEEFGPDRASELAQDLSRDLNRGGNFEAAVREYSRAPSASSGGRLKWVAASELPGPVVNQ